MENKRLKKLYYLRPLWALPIGFFYWLFWFFAYHFDYRSRANYHTNKTNWDCCNTITALNNYFKGWKYKWDGPSGVLDHDNSDLEFFCSGGDCDDVANLVYKRLKILNFQPELVMIWGGENNYHYDVFFRNNCSCFLFNYGQNIIGRELDGCIDNLRNCYNWGKIEYVRVK